MFGIRHARCSQEHSSSDLAQDQKRKETQKLEEDQLGKGESAMVGGHDRSTLDTCMKLSRINTGRAMRRHTGREERAQEEKVEI